MLPHFPNCGHSPTLCSYVFQDISGSQLPCSHRLWHKGKYNMINSHLSVVDWDFEFSYLNVEQMFSRLFSTLRPLIDRYITCITTKVGEQSPKWKFRPSRALVRRHHLLWTQFKAVHFCLGRNSNEAINALRLFQAVTVFDGS